MSLTVGGFPLVVKAREVREVQATFYGSRGPACLEVKLDLQIGQEETIINQIIEIFGKQHVQDIVDAD